MVKNIERFLAWLPDEIRSRIIITDDSFSLPAVCDEGFEVELTWNGDDYLVYLDGYHDHFDDPGDALELFYRGLFPSTCVKRISAGDFPFKYQVLIDDSEDWQEASSFVILLFPFWRRRTSCVLRNHWLVGDIQDPKLGPFVTERGNA